MGDEKHRGAAIFPEAQHFILHAHPGKGVERAEWLVEQENFGVVDKRSRESNTLSHAPGKMVGISTAKCFEADKAHECVYFISFFAQHTSRNKTGLDIATNREPGKQVRVLKDKAAFRTRLTDWLRTD
ncbi:MAG TPA: hypothetical protein VGU90_06225 [Terriglobales bacterium]|nr:hypothetical protein [Terriglobales bacterium]